MLTTAIALLAALAVSGKTPFFADLAGGGEYPRLAPSGAGEERMMIPIDADSIYNFTVILRNNHNSPRKVYKTARGDKKGYRSPGWGIVFSGEGEDEILAVTFRISEETMQLEPQVCTKMTVSKPDSADFCLTLPSSLFPTRSPAILSCNIAGGVAAISGGDDSRKRLWSGELPFEVRSIGLMAEPGSDIELLHSSLIATPPEFIKAGKWSDPYYLDAELSRSADPMLGYWALLDASYEASNTQIGGDYLLAAVAEAGGYTLLYLSGSRSEEWEPGMPKAFLTATSIPGVYNVEWRAAHGGKASEPVKAQIDNGILTFHFPSSNATLRFVAVAENPALSR